MNSGRGLFEGDFKVVAQVASRLSAGAITSSAAAPKEIFKATATAAKGTAKDLGEDVRGVMEAAKAAPTEAAATATTAAFEGGMAVAIVCGTFVLITENLVSFAELLEFFFCFLIVRVFIRVILNGQLAVSLFEL